MLLVLTYHYSQSCVRYDTIEVYKAKLLITRFSQRFEYIFQHNKTEFQHVHNQIILFSESVSAIRKW